MISVTGLTVLSPLSLRGVCCFQSTLSCFAKRLDGKKYVWPTCTRNFTVANAVRTEPVAKEIQIPLRARRDLRPTAAAT